jgi:hypothetical protein
MRQQRFGSRKKLHSVRKPGVQFEGRFINPLRIDREHERFPQRFKYLNAQATGFGARRYIDPKQLIAECRFFARQRLKAHDKVKRQALAPANKYATPNQRLRPYPNIFLADVENAPTAPTNL